MSWYGVASGLCVAGVVIAYVYISRMAKAGSPLFKIGYFLYTKTRIGQIYYQRELNKARLKYNKDGHCQCESYSVEGFRITPIAMSLDNFGYLIREMKEGGENILVDPADTERVKQILEAEQVTPTAILTTHKHWDHSGGNDELRRLYRGIRVYGSALDSVPGVTNPVADGDKLKFGGLSFTVQYTPGHTVGHCIFIMDGQPFGAPPSIFSGDHLFLGGMGRMFEGTASTMLRSLDLLNQLPAETLVWPGHEYAVDNLEFADHVDPDNAAVKEKLAWARQQKKNKVCTCPSTLGEERSYNPFLRTDHAHLQQSLGIEDNVEDKGASRAATLSELRARKDKFKYKL